MKSSVDKLSDTRVKINVEVPFDELTGHIDAAYKELAQQVSIPGFRRGKAPRQLLDARIGRGPILEQVINDMLPEKYGQAVEEHDLTVLGSPQIDISNVDDGNIVEFSAEVDVAPEITIPDFSTYSVTVPPLGTTEDAVSEQLNDLAARFGTMNEVERPAEAGDYVTIDLEVTKDGEKIDDASAEDLVHVLGGENSYEAVSGLSEAVTGLSAGESKEFDTSVGNSDDEGEAASAKVTVKAVKVRELPELDDEFAQMASEFDTLDELKAAIAENAESQIKERQAGAIREEVLKAALEDSPFPLPEGIVEEQVEDQRQQLLQQLNGDEKLLNTMLEAQGTSREEFDKNSRTQAEDAIRTQLFLDALVREVSPSVEQNEIIEHLNLLAHRYGVDTNTLLAQGGQNALVNIYADIRRGKALAEAICKVSVTDTNGETVDPSIYFGADENDEADSEDASETKEK